MYARRNKYELITSAIQCHIRTEWDFKICVLLYIWRVFYEDFRWVTKRSLLDYVLAVFAQVVGEGVERNDKRCGYCYGEIDPPEQSMPVLCFVHEYIDRRRKRTIRFWFYLSALLPSPDASLVIESCKVSPLCLYNTIPRVIVYGQRILDIEYRIRMFSNVRTRNICSLYNIPFHVKKIEIRQSCQGSLDVPKISHFRFHGNRRVITVSTKRSTVTIDRDRLYTRRHVFT